MLKPQYLVLPLLGLLLMTPHRGTTADPPANVWIGTAPFCFASQQDCETFGLDYVRSSKSGEGLPCLSGEKVLCEIPKLRSKPAVPDRLTRFTVVQYNIMDRPFWVGHDGQRERVCRIPQALARSLASQEHLDVIVFNEGFSGVCIEGLRLTDLLAYF